MIARVSYSLTQLQLATGVAQNVAAILALLVGAVWAYFKVSRGRVFEARMTLKATAEFVEKESKRYLVTQLTLENVGQSRIVLDRKACWLLVYDQSRPEPAPRFPTQLKLSRPWNFKVFDTRSAKSPSDDKYWIEPGATQTKIHMLALPQRQDTLACLVEYEIVARRTFWRRSNTLFRTDAIALREKSRGSEE